MILLPTNKHYFYGATVLFLFYAIRQILYIGTLAITGPLGLPGIFPSLIYTVVCILFLVGVITVKKLHRIHPALIIAVTAGWLASVALNNYAWGSYMPALMERYEQAGEGMSYYGKMMGISNLLNYVGRAIAAAGIIVLFVKYSGYRRRLRKGFGITPQESVLGYAIWGLLSVYILFNGEKTVYLVGDILFNYTTVNMYVPIIMTGLYCAAALILVVLSVGKDMPRVNTAIFVVFLIVPGLLQITSYAMNMFGVYAWSKLDASNIEDVQLAKLVTYILSCLWQTAIGVLAYFRYNQLDSKDTLAAS